MNETTLIRIEQFSNTTRQDWRLLKRFIQYHWDLYKDEPQYIPLLNYEYLGFGALGIIGWLDSRHVFFRHAEASFFLAYENNAVAGRIMAYTNENHNRHAGDKTGFFCFYESVNNPAVAKALINAASDWLKSKGMTHIRGPQNLPVNDATPGVLISGYETKPYIYYHYNYPYYASLFEQCGMNVVKRFVGMDVPVQTPIEERLLRVTELTKKRYKITLETFTNKRYNALRDMMFSIYNEAWHDNWGFVPMTREEFNENLHSIKLIWDPKMFIFAYVEGEPAAFFGCVPNILEVLKPIPGLKKLEILRALKMLLGKGLIKSFRQGYFGIRPKFRKIGLDAILVSEAKRYTQTHGYTACDIGWVLEDNELVIRMADFMGGKLSRTYALYEKVIE